MGVNLGKNNLSIYFFRYIEYIDIFLPICRTYRYIYTRRYIDIYIFRFAIFLPIYRTYRYIYSVIYRYIYIFRFAIPINRLVHSPFEFPESLSFHLWSVTCSPRFSFPLTNPTCSAVYPLALICDYLDWGYTCQHTNCLYVDS